MLVYSAALWSRGMDSCEIESIGMELMAEPCILIFKHIIFKVLGSRAGDPAGAKVYGRIRYSRTDAFGCLFGAVMLPILSGRNKGSYSENTVHYKVVYFGFKNSVTDSLPMY